MSSRNTPSDPGFGAFHLYFWAKKQPSNTTDKLSTKCKDSWWCPSSTWRCHFVCLVSFKVGGSTLKKTKTARNWVSCITQNLNRLLSSLKSRPQLIWMIEKGRPLTITKESVNLTNFDFASYFWKRASCSCSLKVDYSNQNLSNIHCYKI